MKRLVILTLVLSLLAGLAGCAGEKPAVTDENTQIPQEEGIVQFVSSLYCDVFAVLYADGSVGVGSKIWYTDSYSEPDPMDTLGPYLPALEWKAVKKLYLNAGCLVALHRDGTVSAVDNFGDGGSLDIAGLGNVKDVAFMEPNSFAFFLMEDGSVEYRDRDPDYDFPYRQTCESWTGVEKLIPWYYNDLFAICSDGSVRSLEGSIPESELPFWQGVQDIFMSGAKFYGCKADGSYVICDPYPEQSTHIPNEERSLTGARSLSAMDEVMFGTSDDGTLFVSGGKDWFYREYAGSRNISLVDHGEFVNIRDLAVNSWLGSYMVVALREDGSLISMNPEINEALSTLENVEHMVVTTNMFTADTIISGLQSNGNVVAVEMFASGDVAIHNYNYCGWIVEDLFAAGDGTLIGFLQDGSIVHNANLSECFFHYIAPQR